MTKEELLRRLQDIEWDDFEVKEAKCELPKNIWETVSAFSNTSGGWIVLGVKQRSGLFEVQGVTHAEKLEQDFLGTLRSQKFNIRLYASTRKYEIDGKCVLAFHIPSSLQKPVYFGNPMNSFVRMGSGDQRATESEIMSMYHDQSFGIRSELVIPETDITMLNAGSFPISPEKMYGTFFSQSRNPTIARLFRFARLAENAGFGLDKLRSWTQLTGRTYSIRSERDYVLVTFSLNDNVVDNVIDKLTKRQQNIFKLLCENNTLSANQIAQRLSITARTVQRDLDVLKAGNLIRRVGVGRGGYWEILNGKKENK